MLYPQINECREMMCLDGFWNFYAERKDGVMYDNPPDRFEMCIRDRLNCI